MGIYDPVPESLQHHVHNHPPHLRRFFFGSGEPEKSVRLCFVRRKDRPAGLQGNSFVYLARIGSLWYDLQGITWYFVIFCRRRIEK